MSEKLLYVIYVPNSLLSVEFRDVQPVKKFLKSVENILNHLESGICKSVILPHFCELKIFKNGEDICKEGCSPITVEYFKGKGNDLESDLNDFLDKIGE